MDELRQADPQPVRIDLGVMQAGGVERGEAEQQCGEAQPAAAEPAARRLDIADRAARIAAGDPDDRAGAAQLAETLSLPTAWPACSIMR
jgi:hypothetical protein